VAFDPAGGLLCTSCRRGQAVAADVVEVLQYLQAGGLARILEEPPSPTATAFEQLGLTAVEHHLDRRLRSSRHLPETRLRGA
jgi:hypothetical protein